MKKPLVITLAGVVLGAGAGWLYWRFVGCASGTCSITSSALNSTLYGSLFGALIFNTFKPSDRDRPSITK